LLVGAFVVGVAIALLRAIVGRRQPGRTWRLKNGSSLRLDTRSCALL